MPRYAGWATLANRAAVANDRATALLALRRYMRAEWFDVYLGMQTDAELLVLRNGADAFAMDVNREIGRREGEL